MSSEPWTECVVRELHIDGVYVGDAKVGLSGTKIKLEALQSCDVLPRPLEMDVRPLCLPCWPLLFFLFHDPLSDALKRVLTRKRTFLIDHDCFLF